MNTETVVTLCLFGERLWVKEEAVLCHVNKNAQETIVKEFRKHSSCWP